MTWFDKYHLLHLQPMPTEPEENSPLFLSEYVVLKDINEDIVTGDKNLYREAILNCQGENEGIFHSHPENKKRYQSHDNLTGIVSASKKLGLSFHTKIWKEIKKQGFRYDNKNPIRSFLRKIFDWRRPVHPRDLIFYGSCAGSRIAKLFLPLLSFICIKTCLKTFKHREEGDNKVKFIHTDGKLLVFMRCYALYDESWIMRKTFKLCTEIIKSKIFSTEGVRTHLPKETTKFENWHGVFKTYFENQDHPNIRLSKGM